MSYDYLNVCRLCLRKEGVSTPIFGDTELLHKITTCLPIVLTSEDKLPKNLCPNCVSNIHLLYDFWQTAINSDKRLRDLIGNMGGIPEYTVATVHTPSGMKPDQASENRLHSAGMMQQVSGHQSNIGIMDNIDMDIPMMISSSNQQQMRVPIDSGSSVQNIQPVAVPSTQATHAQIMQSQASSQEEEESSGDDDDDECEGDDGLPVKEEGEEDPNNRNIEPTAFVDVSCDQPGPSGLQQQKIADMPEMMMSQTADPKAGYFVSKVTTTQRGPGDEHVYAQKHAQVLLVDASLMLKVDMSDAHENNVAQCELCGKIFVSERSLAVHLKTPESCSKEEQLVCELCGCSYSTMPKLREHQKQEHVLLSEEEEEEEEKSQHGCDSCDYVTARREDLIAHHRCHQTSFDLEYQCEECGELCTSKSDIQKHRLSHHNAREKPFQCDVCKATFRYHQGLRLHAKLHQPDYVPPQKKHHCELCNKRFSRRQVLLVHMKTHSNVGPQNEYVCSVCGKAVSSKTYLRVHLRKHTGEKPHVCDLCGKGFISQNYLSVHRRTHTGEKPHRCTHCDKSFTQRTTLVVHLRGHTGDRPYPCTCCHKSFASKTMLNSHLKTHAKQNARQQEQQQQQQEQQQHLQEDEQLQQEEEDDDDHSSDLFETVYIV